MPIPVTIPRLGWNMEEGTFVEWLKADGDAVKSGDVVFRLEGEKATEEIESLDVGTLHIPSTGPKPGDRIAVGAVIGFLLQAGEAPPGLGKPEPRPETRPQPQAKAEPAASPATRRLARERGVDLRQVVGSGPGGRVIPEDLEKPSNPARSGAVSPRARRLAERNGVDTATLTGSGRNGRIRERDVAAGASDSPASKERVIPITPMRRVIAARMLESAQNTAPVTLTASVDATNLVNLRGQFKATADDGLVPSYTDFLVKFVAVALARHPLLAAQWTDAGILSAERIDIGVAVDTDAGLLVPVIRNVPALGLRQVTAQSRALIDRTRSGKLSLADMQGGCFTITNLGAFGIDAFTPIINLPECAILGVGRIERKPVMDGDRVVARELLTLSLTFDHCIVDGAPAARFLQTLVKCIENPAPWLSS